MFPREVRVGTRASLLALAQTRWVIARLQEAAPGVRFTVVTVRTEGDRDRSTPLPAMGGRGVFVREVERRLLQGDIDLAVHSLKDLPTEETPGLTVAAVPVREDPRDALVSRDGAALEALPPGAAVGTGSPRRRAQLAFARPDLVFVSVRGNVDTRVEKAARGELDAVVLAMAGLVRAGIRAPAKPIPFELCLPAAGQGALALPVREGDRAMERLAGLIDDGATHAAVRCERELLRRLGGGCHAPVAAYCRPEGGAWAFDACVGLPDGSRLVRASSREAAPEAARDAVYLRLMEKGGQELLKEAERAGG